jgi:hypothetical protein
MSKKFKVGDKIRCVRSSGTCGNLVEGQVYIVRGHDSYGDPLFEGDEIECGFSYHHFVLVEDPKKMNLIDAFKALHHGKRVRPKGESWSIALESGGLKVISSGGEIYPLYMGLQGHEDDEFEIVEDPFLAIPSLNHKIYKKEDGRLKIGCTEITTSDANKIAKFILGGNNE